MATARYGRSTRKLKPWLVEQIDSGKYPGLMWHDEQKTCFRIPWKHAGKQDFRHDEDAAIFKAWVIYKKKYQPGEKVDAAAWKTRLRCALNKSPEFQELPDKSKLDTSERFKVYRIVPPEEQGIIPFEKQGQKRKSTADSRSSSSDETDPIENEPQIVTLGFQGSEVTSSGSPEDSATIPPLVAPSNETHKDTRLKVTVMYSGIEVAQKVVQSGKCKLSAKAPTEGSPGEMEHVLLPVPGEQFQEDLRSRTEKLLSFIQSGVMLASTTQGILAQRQKSCSLCIYWTGPYSNSQGVINKLERDAFVHLFDTQKFLRDVETYKTQGGTPPEYYVTLCFGEEISEFRHLADKFITAKIEQVFASEMVHQATESLCHKVPRFTHAKSIFPTFYYSVANNCIEEQSSNFIT